MRRTFEKELKELKNDILRMGSLVEDSLNKALTSLESSDVKLAEEVLANDQDIDKLNYDIEEKSTTLTATQCPVARDLRLIHSILFIAVHLERAGDLASNLAKMTFKIKEVHVIKYTSLLEEMGDKASKLIHLSLEAFANNDIKLAKELPKMDEPIDETFKAFFKEIVKSGGDEMILDALSNIILAARYIERIADHAVDIGQRVTYMVTGDFQA